MAIVWDDKRQRPTGLNLVAVRLLLCLWISVLKMVATFLSLPLDFQSASTATVGVL
uniref:Uncharacterized protein n=1 Tax=Manihot esculenta TaxID=3983 RepID=A0A2C9UE52_MANES